MSAVELAARTVEHRRALRHDSVSLTRPSSGYCIYHCVRGLGKRATMASITERDILALPPCLQHAFFGDFDDLCTDLALAKKRHQSLTGFLGPGRTSAVALAVMGSAAVRAQAAKQVPKRAGAAAGDAAAGDAGAGDAGAGAAAGEATGPGAPTAERTSTGAVAPVHQPAATGTATGQPGPPGAASATRLHTTTIEVLVRNGWDIDAPDAKGFTPLMFACGRYACAPIAAKLLALGASPHCTVRLWASG